MDIQKNFSYHPPKPGQAELYSFMRDSVRLVAEIIQMGCPESRERSLALTKLEEAVMWANASIARNT